MKTSFAKLHNGLAIRLEEIPRMNIGPWRERILQSCRDSHARIVALFAHREELLIRLFSVLGLDTTGELRIASAELSGKNPSYPSLTPDLPEAQAFEREIWEQYGILPEGHPWLKPLRKLEGYPFYRVEGEAVHEVAVGPVHAGIIEPGHFRFQCHGEKAFHLEIALGYQHRGVEAMMPKAKVSRRALLAESIAGDTAVGHALAYAQALEGLAEKPAGAGPPASQRAESLRAVALELERLANHAGDLGALAADVGFLPANAYFGRLRGEFLNLLMELTGNRYGRSFVRPGGVLFDLNDSMRDDFQKRILKAGSDLKEVAELFFSASTVLSRLEQTGVLSRETARALGLVGPAARASGLSRDVRQDYPFGAYRFHYLTPVRLSTGDVYARARLRSLECKRSLEFIGGQLESLVHEKSFGETGPPKSSSLILSLVEGWRGEIAHLLITGELGEIVRYKAVDPSFHNWMGLALALRNGQISDFPLCNKSFNLSYAGHDL